ncbi:MAG: AAA family ATPase [Bacteroidota bacterium]
MEKLIENHHQVLKDTPISFIRRFTQTIQWEERLIGIKGAKGVGKTTLILQYIKKQLQNKKTIYLSLDNLYFFRNGMSETIESFIKLGYTHFFLDEVHKYPTWSTEIKNLYDIYRKINIVYTGSSILHLTKGTADLSRRAMLYNMPGLSFREYLVLTTGNHFPVFALEEILENHESIALDITKQIKPFEFFNTYLQTGYYPFFIETPKTYNQRLESAINQTLEGDLPLIRNISPEVIIKLKKLLGVIAQSAPFKPNIQKISERIGVSRNSLIVYLKYLEEGSLIRQLYTSIKGIGSLQKPDKIYLENPNLIHTLSDLSSQTGTVRETFVLNQLSSTHTITYPRSGDFFVNEKYLLEVGGKGKSQRQIHGIENSFILSDDIEIGYGNRIPLWLMGFLY